MIPKYRERYNAEFSPEKYAELNEKLAKSAGTEVAFRLSESPIFLTGDFKNKLLDAAESIISQIKNMPPNLLESAVPANCRVPGDTRKPHFLTIDFAICRNENTGQVEPQLIELQAFPSLYAFQKILEETILEQYPFISEIKNSPSQQEYLSILKKIILGDENPENVILLEIYPERQKTNVDFALTEKFLGVKTVCLTKIRKKGRQLFYDNNGVQTLVKRIYNRVIFDELDKIPGLETQFDFREAADVEWVTHPNWFFKISKFILPMLQHQFVPKSYFLNDFPKEENLEDFVLKPLFSFAGSGVNLHPTADDISKIRDTENYILQRKVTYEPLFEDIRGEKSKAEIRLLYTWDDDAEDPRLLDNLVRMTKAEMANVDYNKRDLIWTGSTVAFFES